MDISVSENDTNVLVSVTLEQEIAIPVTVDIAVVNGTATEGEGQCIGTSGQICIYRPCIKTCQFDSCFLNKQIISGSDCRF